VRLEGGGQREDRGREWRGMERKLLLPKEVLQYQHVIAEFLLSKS